METTTSPKIPKKFRHNERVSYAPCAGDMALFRTIAEREGESVATWLRMVVARAGMAGVRLHEPPTKEEPRVRPEAFRVNERQREAILASAEASGLKISDYVIAAALAEARRLGVK